MLKVCENACDQCLFSKGRIVSAARVREILKECKQQDTHFVCHKASIAGREVCCRTFYDTKTSNLIRIMQRLNGIEFVDPATGKPTQKEQAHDHHRNAWRADTAQFVRAQESPD